MIGRNPAYGWLGELILAYGEYRTKRPRRER